MNKNTNFNVGGRIRELRIQRGLSQEQLALASGITTTYLGLLERNRKNPTVKIIEQLCEAMHISLLDFFNPAVQDKSSDILSEQILGQLSGRSDEEKRLILQTIKNILKLRDLP